MTFKTIFTDENNEDFISLAKKLWEGYVESSGDIVKKYQEFNTLEGEHFVILIFDSEKAIACGSFKEFSKDTVEIKRVFVDKEYRRRKLALCIMKGLEEIAKEKSYKYAVLETGAKNKASRKFYKKLDYDIIERFVPLEGMPICLQMKKKL
jgi:ribosomal protein S18 acetylase RimI-like enzyme